jgi:hypothetical protein
VSHTERKTFHDAIFNGGGIRTGIWLADDVAPKSLVTLEVTSNDGTSSTQIAARDARDLGWDLFAKAFTIEPALLVETMPGQTMIGHGWTFDTIALVPVWVRELLVDALAFTERAILSELYSCSGDDEQRDALAARLRQAVGS